MPNDLSQVLESTEPTLLAAGLGRTEGPLWNSGGYLTFVDLEGSRLLRWDGNCSVVRENTGEGNGCTLDRQGRVIMCESANRRITSMEEDGSVTSIADRWQGMRFNRPNDVICRSDGSIFFTDPSFRVPRRIGNTDSPGCFGLIPPGCYTSLPTSVSIPTAWPSAPTSPYYTWLSAV